MLSLYETFLFLDGLDNYMFFEERLFYDIYVFYQNEFSSGGLKNDRDEDFYRDISRDDNK